MDASNSEVNINTKHCPLTPALEKYVTSRVARLTQVLQAHIRLDVHLEMEKYYHIAIFILSFPGVTLRSEARTEDMYESIDKCFDKVEKLLSKYKERLKEHTAIPCKELELQAEILQPHDTDIINRDIEEENAKEEALRYDTHKIVSRERLKVKMLTEPEAMMYMECSARPFMVYKSEESQRLKIIYLLEDGNFGLISL